MKDDSPTPLSERERRVLAEMELALRRESPELVARLSAQQRHERRRRHMVGWGTVAAGVVVLVVGLLTGLVPVGFVGFVVVLSGVYVLTAELTPQRLAAALRRTFGLGSH